MTAPQTKLLNLQTQKQTSLQSELVIASFFDLDGMADAVTSEGFTLREEIALLIDSMRSDDPKVRLAAQKQWHTLKKDILTANGLLGTSRARETVTVEDGRTIERSASTQTLLTRIRKTQESNANVLDRSQDPSFTFLGPRDGARPDPVALPDRDRDTAPVDPVDPDLKAEAPVPLEPGPRDDAGRTRPLPEDRGSPHGDPA